MQRDEDALVQQRLFADRLRRGSTIVEASGDERNDPGLPSGVGHKHLEAEVRKIPREREQKLRGAVEMHLELGGQKNPCKRRQKMPKREED